MGHKLSLGKLKETVVLSIIFFSDLKAVGFDINYRKNKTVKNTNTWRLNNMLLNSPEVAEATKPSSVQ